MTLKPGVRVLGLRPEILLAIQAAEGLWRDAGLPGVTITSAVDGRHSSGSEHYVGAAVDFRVHDLPTDRRRDVVAALKTQLGEDYDVLWEAIGLANEHVHVEFDPKRAMTD